MVRPKRVFGSGFGMGWLEHSLDQLESMVVVGSPLFARRLLSAASEGIASAVVLCSG